MDCSKYFWKLDKLDKVVISFIFIVFTIFTVFKSFCFADYELPKNIVNGYGIFKESGVDVIRADNNRFGFYYDISPGYTYTIYNRASTGILGIGLLNEFPRDGLQVSNFELIQPGSSTSLTVDNDSLLYIFGYSSLDDVISSASVSVNGVDNGMQYSIFQLSNFLASYRFWDIFSLSIPYILVVVVVSFGFYIIFKLIRRLSKGKNANV